MHISDGVLSTAVTAVTYAGATGLLAFSIKGVKHEEIPKMALMTGVFFVGSMIRVPLGPTSIHLMLTGFVGLVAGRRAPISVTIALLLQLFLLQFGGLSSLGANILMAGLPAMLIGMFLRPLVHKSNAMAAVIGAVSGGGAVLSVIVLLAAILTQANMRFGVGPLSTVRVVAVAHVPLVIVEAIVTAAAVLCIAKIRPEFFGRKQAAASMAEGAKNKI